MAVEEKVLHPLIQKYVDEAYQQGLVDGDKIRYDEGYRQGYAVAKSCFDPELDHIPMAD